MPLPSFPVKICPVLEQLAPIGLSCCAGYPRLYAVSRPQKNTDRFVCFWVFIYICTVKHSEVRQNIIKTASFLFYKNGYNSTGINEIIAETGIAKATLYSHFRSKEDLCRAYIRFKSDAFASELETFCRSKRKGKEQILALFEFLRIFYHSNEFYGCWCMKTIAEIPMENEKVRSEIQQQKNKFIDLINVLINNNLKYIPAGKTETIAKRIYLMYESAVGESYLHQEDWPIKEAKEICSQIIA